MSKELELLKEAVKMLEDKFWQKYNAFKNHALKGNCIKLCYELDKFVDDRLK